MSKLSPPPLSMIAVDVSGHYYPEAIASEIKRLLASRFKWQYTSSTQSKILTIRPWKEGDDGEPETPMVPPLDPIPRSLVRDLVSALANYAPPTLTVKEYIERYEKASCHVGLTSVYGCAHCSRNIAAIRALQVAKAHGLLE